MRRRSNTPIVFLSLGLIAVMVTLVAFSVPLYRLFCQVTGYGGTTQTAEAAEETVIEREMTIRFNADVDPDLPWTFAPKQRTVTVKVGEQSLAHYYAENLTDKPITGRAVYNVTPQKAGLYFAKVHCFCFDEQTLAPGESADMPVTFFVDPAIAEDDNLDEVKTITLSYTFFRAGEGKTEQPDMAAAAAPAAKVD